MKRIVLAATAVLISAAAFAGNGIDKAAQSGFTLHKHEIAVGGAFLPGHDMVQLGWIGSAATVGSDGAWWLSYTYNFTKLFALQFSVAYDGFKWESDPVETGSLDTGHEFYITPMLSFRCSWLNRKIVRLYSSAGVGLVIDSDPWYTMSSSGKDLKHRCRFGWQVTPIGISVGKKLYGYAELGVGTIYYVGCAGIGYRF